MLNLGKYDSLGVAVRTAIHSGDLDALRRLLDDDPGLVTARIDGRTLLHVAADWPGQIELCGKSLMRRANRHEKVDDDSEVAGGGRLHRTRNVDPDRPQPYSPAPPSPPPITDDPRRVRILSMSAPAVLVQVLENSPGPALAGQLQMSVSPQEPLHRATAMVIRADGGGTLVKQTECLIPVGLAQV